MYQFNMECASDFKINMTQLVVIYCNRCSHSEIFPEELQIQKAGKRQGRIYTSF